MTRWPGALFAAFVGCVATIAAVFLAANPVAAASARGSAAYARSLDSEADFKRFARTYQSGDLADQPHVLFIVERASGAVFYADGSVYDFHGSFARALGLTKAVGKDFFAENYRLDTRPLILGTLVYEKKRARYVFEFSDADRLSETLVRQTFAALKPTFFASLTFRANSLLHEQVLSALKDLPTELSDSLRDPKAVAVHRKGIGTGVLRLATEEDALALPPETIAVFKAAPVTIVPVRGIVTEMPGSPLSHLHMLARTWKIPDVNVPDARAQWAAFEGRWVTLTATGTRGVALRLATEAEKSRSAAPRQNEIPALASDLTARDLVDLFKQRRADAKRFGAKSAQLGEIAAIPGVAVPPGFSIPFAYFKEHLVASGAEAMLAAVPKEAAARRAALEAIRARMQTAPFSPALRALLSPRFAALAASGGVFVRSSTNAEDLPRFSGAGLYTTVPNVKDEAALVEAVKTVWASVWNLEAYEAREAAGIDHAAVMAGVLIQHGVNADCAGVLITRNPYNADDNRSVYINAKRGLGIRVVNGNKIPEQLLFSARTGGIKVLSRSEEASELIFSAHGGVEERPLGDDGPRVLTVPQVKDLVRAAHAIQQRFGGKTVDVEWVEEKGHAIIVQGRLYQD